MEVFGSVAMLVAIALIVWLMRTLVPFVREVIRMRTAVAGLPSLPNVWPFGTLPLMRKIGRENLYQYMAQVIKTKKVKVLVFWRTSLVPVILAIHPETAGQILRTSDPKNRKYGGAYELVLPWLGEGLLLSSGRKWERNRKLLTPAFHFKILQPYVKIYNDAVEIFMDKIQESIGTRSSYEIFGPVAMFTLDVMLRCTCSVDDGIQLQGSSHPYVKAMSRFTHLFMQREMRPWTYYNTLYKLTPSGREFFRLCDYVHKFTEDIIEKRKEALANDKDQLTKRHLDFLDILLTARDEDNVGLSKEDIRAEVDTFLFEGHDTTASAIAWSLYTLAKYPDVQDKVFRDVKKVVGDTDYLDWNGISELSYTNLFLKEVLRMYSPVVTTGRMLSKPITIDGVEIPAGSLCGVPLYVLHHNPDVWENPEEFRPERFSDDAFLSRDPYSFVPFSAGPRNCIGQNFALNEEKVAIARIVNRFKIELDLEHEVVLLPELVMRAKHGIKLKFTTRT